MDINWLLFAIAVFAFIFKIDRLEKRIKALEQSYPNWENKFYELEEEFEEVERELKREIEHWKSKYYTKGVY